MPEAVQMSQEVVGALGVVRGSDSALIRNSMISLSFRGIASDREPAEKVFVHSTAFLLCSRIDLSADILRS